MLEKICLLYEKILVMLEKPFEYYREFAMNVKVEFYLPNTPQESGAFFCQFDVQLLTQKCVRFNVEVTFTLVVWHKSETFGCE